MTFRDAQPSDCEAVAELHAWSWRTAYERILSRDFLDNRAVEDRLLLWRARLADNADRQWVRLAIDEDRIVGFACVLLDEHERWGALLSNLHVAPDMKGRGIGRELIRETAHWVVDRRPQSGLHLWVYEENHPARGFYEHIGGAAVERKLQRAPDGNDIPVVRYVWQDLRCLAEAEKR